MIELTRPGKNSLTVECPVMPAAGTLGYGDLYRDLIDFEKLGAFVTNPVTYQPRTPAAGTHVVTLDAGILLHTGLPNPGLNKVVGKYRQVWKAMPLPVIVHVIATTVHDVERCAAALDREETVDALELGLNDDISPDAAAALVQAAVDHCDKPILARLPMTDTDVLARAAEHAGAGGLVVCAPPRGTARDTGGRLVGGRVYSPVIKPLVLRLVGQIVRRVGIPVIGAGGIHSPDDARDYLEAGASAVQVDSVTWVNPKMLEVIARDLGGLVLTRASGAFLDEWHPGIGMTERMAAAGDDLPPPADPPPDDPQTQTTRRKQPPTA